mgnify:CR=1 FL=1
MKLRSTITWTLLIALVIGGVAYWQMRKNSAPAQAVAPASTATNTSTASELLAGSDSAQVHTLVAEMVAWTRAMMRIGAPLAHRLGRRVGWELRRAATKVVGAGRLCCSRLRS